MKVCYGYNVEYIYISHDIHAEVNAISTMVANGEKDLVAVLVVATREMFTPCGSCMDWIFQFGGANCLIRYESEPGKKKLQLTAGELMPFYPM